MHTQEELKLYIEDHDFMKESARFLIICNDTPLVAQLVKEKCDGEKIVEVQSKALFRRSISKSIIISNVANLPSALDFSKFDQVLVIDDDKRLAKQVQNPHKNHNISSLSNDIKMRLQSTFITILKLTSELSN